MSDCDKTHSANWFFSFEVEQTKPIVTMKEAGRQKHVSSSIHT